MKERFNEEYSTFSSEETAKAIIANEERRKKEAEDRILKKKGISRLLEVEKCLQVLKYITKKHLKPDIYNVLKMLYFADKIHLLKYGKLIAPDKYVKLEYGPVPSLCYDILKFVRGTSNHPFDEGIKEEIEVYEEPKTGKKDKLRNLTEPELEYLSNTNIECLEEAIRKYGRLGFGDLKKLSHDEIYNSVPNINDEITIFHMLKILDNKELAKQSQEQEIDF
jgi:uncharacterized phage-associated protein